MASILKNFHPALACIFIFPIFLVSLPASAASSRFSTWASVTNAKAYGCSTNAQSIENAGGAYDSTDAINCLLQYAGVAEERKDPQGKPYPFFSTVFIPAGTYQISKTLLLTTYSIPNEPNERGAVRLTGHSAHSTILQWTGPAQLDASGKGPAMLQLNGMGRMGIDQIAFDGMKSAGLGLEMLSFKAHSTGFTIYDTAFRNFKQIGILIDRMPLTDDENNDAITSHDIGMVSEVTIKRSSFNNIEYAGIATGTFNALDVWVWDSHFNNCYIGVTNEFGLDPNGGTGLAWTSHIANQKSQVITGAGAFQVYRSMFENSKLSDIMVNNLSSYFSFRNNQSFNSNSFFTTLWQSGGGEYTFQGNHIVAAEGQIPFVILNRAHYKLLQNWIVTQPSPGTSRETPAFRFQQLSAPSSLDANVPWIFPRILSLQNKYSASMPFMTSAGQILFPPNSAANLGALICSDASGTPQVGAFSTCMGSGFQNPNRFEFFETADTFNVAGMPEKYALAKSPQDPIGFLKEVKLHASDSSANMTALQNAVNQLADLEASGKNKPWSILHIPSGIFPLAGTLTIPKKLHLQLVGDGPGSILAASSIGNPTQTSALIQVEAPGQILIQDLQLANSSVAPMTGPALQIHYTPDTQGNPIGHFFAEDLNGDYSNFTVPNIGEVTFDLQSFQAATLNLGGSGSIAKNTGWFGIFGGGLDASNSISNGAIALIQDTWHEGKDGTYITISGPSQVTIDAINIATTDPNHNNHLDSDSTNGNPIMLSNFSGEFSLLDGSNVEYSTNFTNELGTDSSSTGSVYLIGNSFSSKKEPLVISALGEYDLPPFANSSHLNLLSFMNSFFYDGQKLSTQAPIGASTATSVLDGLKMVLNSDRTIAPGTSPELPLPANSHSKLNVTMRRVIVQNFSGGIQVSQ